MSTRFTHVLYQLEDSGSTYPFYNVALYPGLPVDADTVPAGLLSGLLENKHVARCDTDGNLAPATRRFVVLPTGDEGEDTQEMSDPVVTDIVSGSPVPQVALETNAISEMLAGVTTVVFARNSVPTTFETNTIHDVPVAEIEETISRKHRGAKTEG